MLLPGRERRDLARRIAVDRSASAPDPGVLAALVCPPGELQIDIEARGLASLRIMALDALDDRALMARIRDDPTEPNLVRYWMTRMLGSGPDRSHPDRKRLLDWRQRHAREQAMLEFTARDTSPCFIVHPKPDPPALPPGLIDVHGGRVGVVAIDSKAHCGDPLGAETGEHRRPGPPRWRSAIDPRRRQAAAASATR